MVENLKTVKNSQSARVSLPMTKTAVFESAREDIGGFSKPSKMPWISYSIPAKFCKTGSKLAKMDGTVCSECYALKGRYLFGNVQNAMSDRFETIENDGWVNDFSRYLNSLASMEKNKDILYFRWHDSGDIQSIEHLAKIVKIAENCPTIQFWIPTREYGIVEEYIKTVENGFGYVFPTNLNVRLSTHMIDSKNTPKIGGLTTSTVHTDENNVPENSEICQAYTRQGKCADCRLCWDKNVKNVSYPKH